MQPPVFVVFLRFGHVQGRRGKRVVVKIQGRWESETGADYVPAHRINRHATVHRIIFNERRKTDKIG
jgi:hypothetical protein